MRVLFTWELGSGFGHIFPIATVGGRLADLGHTVFAAVREPARVAYLKNPPVIRWLTAPALHGSVTVPRPAGLTCFAHILHSIGFGSAATLLALTDAWRKLFDLTRPDVIIFDHSPTALLASRGLSVRRVLMGSGFDRPPRRSPLGVLNPHADQSQMIRDEAALVGTINQVLRNLTLQPMSGLADLYYDGIDDHLLTTFPSLDHFGPRDDAEYFGPIPPAGMQAAPPWPSGDGNRIYAYLKAGRPTGLILKLLAARRHPTILVSDRINQETLNTLGTTTIRCSTTPVDLDAVTAGCSLAITHAGAGTTAGLLLRDIPLLMLPLNMEQYLTASNVAKLGAGRIVLENHWPHMGKLLDEALQPGPRQAAARFAQDHADYDPDAMLGRMIERLIAGQ